MRKIATKSNRKPPLRKPPRLSGKVQNKGIKPVKKPKKKKK